MNRIGEPAFEKAYLVWHMLPRQTQVSLASAQPDQSSLSAWRNVAFLAIKNAPSANSDQTAQIHRLIWNFAHAWDEPKCVHFAHDRRHLFAWRGQIDSLIISLGLIWLRSILSKLPIRTIVFYYLSSVAFISHQGNCFSIEYKNKKHLQKRR